MTSVGSAQPFMFGAEKDFPPEAIERYTESKEGMWRDYARTD